MRVYRLSGCGVLIVAAVALCLWVGSNRAHTEMLPQGSTDRPIVKMPAQDWVAKHGQPAWLQGHPAYAYEGVQFFAPVPAVKLKGVESKQWRWDYLTFEFDKLKDRQLLYAYYLSSPKSKKVGEVLEAVMAAAAAYEAKGKPLWIAIGVEYDIKNIKSMYHAIGIELKTEAEWFRNAAVPVMWSEETYELFKKKHDAETFASVISGAARMLPSVSYANYWALTEWSGAAKAFGNPK